MAASVGEVRAALRGLLQTHMRGIEVHAFEPDRPGRRAAWIWIDGADYDDYDGSVGGGYHITAEVSIQLPYPSSAEAQDTLDRYISRSTGPQAWIAADTTLGGVVRLADVLAVRIELGETGDKSAFAVAKYKVDINV